jgi:hypothetical protein
MKRLLLFLVLTLLCPSAYADIHTIKARLKRDDNGATCRHIEIRDNVTDAVLEVTSIDELRERVSPRDSYLIRQIKRRLKESGVSTLTEARDAVQGMTVDNEL